MVPAIVNRPATCRKKYAFGARWEQVEFFFQIRDRKKNPTSSGTLNEISASTF